MSMFQKISWPKASTIQNINVNVPRKSMKAIIPLFKDKNSDNEFFPYPNLKTIPNKVYSRDLTKRLIDYFQIR